ncbi:MAG: thiol-disulfide isomerase/thioredoxin [Phenylobacterium sp.]|jgi:thiol-disulfide isomerase/thioredoxin
MRYLKLLLLWLLCLSFNAFSAEPNQSQPFSPGHLDTLTQQYEGKRWLILLWSLDCPPCFKELAAIGQLHQQNPSLPVVLINTDGDDMLDEQRINVVNKYQLTTLNNFHFADGKAAQGRYLIDPSWYGELPRSYFYQVDGQRVAKSGLVKAAVLRRWLGGK